MRASIRSVVLGCWACWACGGSAPPAETAAERADPLLGAWWTGTAPDGDPLPCPLEIEVFADGTAELDYLNDDSEEKMCSFARVPVERSAGDPPVVRFAGQLTACLWRREGPRLRLACEDHLDPPADFSTSMLLERRPVRPLEGFDAIVGTWASAGFWSESRSITIAPDGHIRFLGGEGRVSVTDEGQLAIEIGEHVLRCRYRAIVDRLTMRCGAPDAPAPDGFAGPQPILETLVLRRRGGPTPSPPRFGRPALSVPGGRGGDRDGDGSRDGADRCPDEPEDHDAFEDQDGCPEPDNDRDGVLDVDDRCPEIPETRNGRDDADGCPESAVGTDRDGDGAADSLDRCPDDPEDWDGLQDEDGCPDPDNDLDGVLDVDDLCPNDPEDRDGFQDEDGCPDLDNDHDRIVDANDRCPNEPEDEDGLEDDDGCPDPDP